MGRAAGRVGGDARSAPRLLPPAPNPSSGSVRLGFTLERPADTRLAIVDLEGRIVARIVAGRLGSGTHARTWNGVDDHGRHVECGIYLARLEADGRAWTRRIALVR